MAKGTRIGGSICEDFYSERKENIIIPQILEQEVTARRVQELGLGIAFDKATVTIDGLREAMTLVAHDSTFRTRA
ncbi:MAG: hypothetical protein NVS4B11_38860 [Ktedonobacteraceae bacterium]